MELLYEIRTAIPFGIGFLLFRYHCRHHLLVFCRFIFILAIFITTCVLDIPNSRENGLHQFHAILHPHIH